MSVLQAGHKQAVSKYDPLHLALMAQNEIGDLRHKIEIQAALVRQLMVHRVVRQIDTGKIFKVREVRVVNGRIILRGRHHSRRDSVIGPLASVEIIDPPEPNPASQPSDVTRRDARS
jgi:hypothetical protein